MTEVISIKFRGKGKPYYFAPGSITAKPGDKLVVETSKGMELGDCSEGNHMVEDTVIVPPLRPVIRQATASDRRVEEINRARETEALAICRRKIEKHGLEMKLVDVECSFEGNKIIFFFTADGRVDFRELVKDLAGEFRARIELRQIGVRDEARMLGGLGICGRPFCCHEFLDEFQPVSTKMAKTQSMSLNPVKISGTCGRLMCCLRYEQEAYEDLVKHVPKNGAFVETEDGYGNVTLVNLLRQSVKVKLDSTGDPVFHTYPVDEIAEVPGGRPPEGQPLPHVLQPRQKKKEEPEEKEENPWFMPSMLPEEAEETAGEKAAEAPAHDGEKTRRRRHRGHRSGGNHSSEESAAQQPKKEQGHKPAASAKSAAKSQNASGTAKAQSTAGSGSGEEAARKKNSRSHHHRHRSHGGGAKQPGKE